MVTVKILPSGKTFTFNKKILCHQSASFDATFNGHFRESNGLVEIEEDLETFKLYFKWIYSGKLFDTPYTEDNYAERSMQLVQLHVLADARLTPALCNAVVDELLEGCTQTKVTVVKPDVVNFVYENTVPSSKLRKLFVSFCLCTEVEAAVHNFRRNQEYKYGGPFVSDFWFDVYAALVTGKRLALSPRDGNQRLQPSQYYQPLEHRTRLPHAVSRVTAQQYLKRKRDESEPMPRYHLAPLTDEKSPET